MINTLSFKQNLLNFLKLLNTSSIHLRETVTNNLFSFFIFTSLKAIHNKDYSVVKTFKAVLTNRFFRLGLLESM